MFFYITLLFLGLQCNLSQVDWDKLQYYSRKVKFFIALPPDNYDVEVHRTFILRLIFGLPNFSHLLSFHLFVTSATIWTLSPSLSLSLFLFLSPSLDSLELFNISRFDNTIVEPFFGYPFL